MQPTCPGMKYPVRGNRRGVIFAPRPPPEIQKTGGIKWRKDDGRLTEGKIQFWCFGGQLAFWGGFGAAGQRGPKEDLVVSVRRRPLTRVFGPRLWQQWESLELTISLENGGFVFFVDFPEGCWISEMSLKNNKIYDLDLHREMKK